MTIFSTPPSTQGFNYPATRRDDVADDYHGTSVCDPYRWLEDPEATQTWVAAQNQQTTHYLQDSDCRAILQTRLIQLWNYPRYSVPVKEGNRYFFFKNDGLQNQYVLYTQRHLEEEPQVVLDPNLLSPDGTVSMVSRSFSKDGRLLAYGLSQSGSDCQEIHIRTVDTRTDYDEVLHWCKFPGLAWRHDGMGFFYNRFPAVGTVPKAEENYYNRVYYHQLGTLQDEDLLVYEQPEAKELSFTPLVTDDGEYLILHVTQGTNSKNRIYYRAVASSEPFIYLLDKADASYRFIGNTGSIFYFHTNLQAPCGRIVAIDLHHPAPEHWQEVIPEKSAVISFVTLVCDQLVVAYLHEAHHRLQFYTRQGVFLRELALPTMGAIAGLSGRCEDTEMFLSFTSFLYPPSIFRYDFMTEELTLFRGAEIQFDPAGYETQQVFFTSKDGTRVPMFLTHRKGLVLDGTHPTLLYGYGGFTVDVLPSFSVSRLLWLEAGGVYASVNLRGGSEYGEAWHQAGMLANKQNVFDDFIAAAEWLIAQGYTRPERLASNGGSNGGLLVAACMLQRPDLFGAVVCQVPVTDMLRYHRFTVGHYWIPEYGNAEASPEEFAYLYAYSPLHNIQPGVDYPPILVTTADTDDRVVPAHAKKFAAALQFATKGNHPVLLRVETRAGHGGGKPVAKIIEEQADVYAFLFKVFGVPRLIV
ncbi:prolyl oligopeptidase family serine peptidase [Anthocerotibacter panamensis]|uniref:prolyl oligopeptidase family serine peptidase n=1 Tax=Anthocerotibacter panamensis TaxID=2857077 RepID=UPI001FD913EB|nr:prolyl oligopeptidase family serine peptidase [Anthocerotibacter panamensis]